MPDPIEPFDLPVIPLPAALPWDEEEDALSHENDLLSRLRVASPCDASWDEMEGDEKVRFCRHCRKHVYNLSWMSRREAAAFVRQTEERLRVRFYRRRDGTLLADNCPVGLRAAERRLLACIAGMGAVELSLSAVMTPALASLMLLAPLLVLGIWNFCAGEESGMGEPSPVRAAPPPTPESSRQTDPSRVSAPRPRYRRAWHQRWGRGQWG